MLAEIEPLDLKELFVDKGRSYHQSKGYQPFGEGDENINSYLYRVVDGIGGLETVSTEGAIAISRVLKPGTIFGTDGFIGPYNSRANFYTESTVERVQVDPQDPAAKLALTELLVQEVRERTDAYVLLHGSQSTAPRKVAYGILDFAAGRELAPVGQEILGQRIGLTRTFVGQTIKEFRAQGILGDSGKRRKNEIVIADLTRLHQKAQIPLRLR